MTDRRQIYFHAIAPRGDAEAMKQLKALIDCFKVD